MEQSQKADFQAETLNSTLNQKRYRAKSEILNEAETSEINSEKQTQFCSDARPQTEDLRLNEKTNPNQSQTAGNTKLYTLSANKEKQSQFSMDLI